MLTNQEIYDKVKSHLLTQGVRSKLSRDHLFVGSGGCAYRGQDNTKCAVGCLIPDELYDYKIEGRAVLGSPLLVSILTKLGISDESYGLLVTLQEIHDSYDPALWESRLRTLAINYKLKP